MRYLLDTNAILYALGGRLRDPLPVGELYASVISEIETLSYPSLTPAEEKSIRDFFSSIEVIPLDDTIKTETIRIRRAHRLKIPDAIVLASCQTTGATLLTNDQRILSIPGIASHPVPLRSL